jgi:hypothetical protein
VFLWVALVLHNLLDWLQNLYAISELFLRLSQLPTDLDEVDRHMWGNGESPKLLQLVMMAR